MRLGYVMALFIRSWFSFFYIHMSYHGQTMYYIKERTSIPITTASVLVILFIFPDIFKLDQHFHEEARQKFSKASREIIQRCLSVMYVSKWETFSSAPWRTVCCWQCSLCQMMGSSVFKITVCCNQRIRLGSFDNKSERVYFLRKKDRYCEEFTEIRMIDSPSSYQCLCLFTSVCFS